MYNLDGYIVQCIERQGSLVVVGQSDRCEEKPHPSTKKRTRDQVVEKTGR